MKDTRKMQFSYLPSIKIPKSSRDLRGRAIYFDITGIGKLYEEYTFFEYAKMPVVLVTVDQDGRRYLCLNTDMEGRSWIVEKVREQILLNFAMGEISLGTVYKYAENRIYLIDKKENKVFAYSYHDFPEEEKPEDDDFYVDPEDTVDYQIRLLTDMEQFNYSRR